MAILNSDLIYAFPATKRGEVYNQKARLLREESIVNMTDMTVDTDGYVITTNYNSTTLEFCINGYYFNVNMNAVKAVGTGVIYATIGLQQTGDYLELAGQDTVNPTTNINQYPGVVFTVGTPGDVTTVSNAIANLTGYALSGDNVIVKTYSIPLIDTSNDKKCIYTYSDGTTSNVRFNRSSIRLGAIDGGVLV